MLYGKAVRRLEEKIRERTEKNSFFDWESWRQRIRRCEVVSTIDMFKIYYPMIAKTEAEALDFLFLPYLSLIVHPTS